MGNDTGSGLWPAPRCRPEAAAPWDGPFASLAEVLTIDPVDPFTVYGGGLFGLFVSHEGGVTWMESSGPGRVSATARD